MKILKRNRRPKVITIPLTAQDLTITAFFATQQLLTNLSNKQDPILLQSDIAECLHTTSQAISHLPIGTWDDDLLRAILESSDSVITKDKEETNQTDSDPSTIVNKAFNDAWRKSMQSESNEAIETPESEPNGINADKFWIDENTSILIDTSKAEVTLLGIARHLSNLVSELGSIAKDMLGISGQLKVPKPKANTIKAHKFNKRSASKKKPIAKRKILDDYLPECIWFIHKGTKFYLLGRDADAALGRIPSNKLTVAEYTTMMELERQANNQSPKRDSKTKQIVIDKVVRAVNGNPTGETLSDEVVGQKRYDLELQDIDIAFNLTIRQVAVLCRCADETLPVEITEREAFITERSRHFSDAPAWIAFAVRGFFLERLMAYSLTPAVNRI